MLSKSGWPSEYAQASAFKCIEITSADWDETTIPRRPWIVPGYIMRGSVTVIVGPGAAGKSSLGVAHSVALALGQPFHRFICNKSHKVVVYNAEDDADEQRRRFSAMLRWFGKKPRDLKNNISIVGTNEVGQLLRREPDKGRITFTEAMDELDSHVKTFKPDVLILDPLVELHDCDENDNTALKAIIARFRQFAIEHKIGVVIMHHVRKGSSGQAGDPDIARGAGAIVGAARNVMTLMVMTADEARGLNVPSDKRSYYCRLDSAKQNYSPPSTAEWFERVVYELENGDDLIEGDRVAIPVPWTPPQDVLTPEKLMTIEAAVAKGSMHGPWSSRLSSDARSIQHLMVESGITTRSGQQTAISALIDDGFLISSFKNANRVEAKGFQSPEGFPKSDGKWKWVE